MDNYIKFIVRYRFLVIGLISMISLLSGVVLSNMTFSGSLAELMLGESPGYPRYLERGKEFGGDQLILIAFEEKNLFSKPSIRRLKKAVHQIKALPPVKNVRSILDLRDLRVVEGVPVADFYADIALNQPERSDEILEKMAMDPLISELWVSKDGRHSMVVIELVYDEKRSDQELPPLIKEILMIFEDAGFDRSTLHLAGQIPILVETLRQAIFNLLRLFPVVCLVLFITVYILFQRFWPVFITLVVTSLGVLWTMALAITLFGRINVMTAMVPGIIMIIAFSDVIHLCNSYQMEISKGEQKARAIEKSCSEVGSACLFTSITTFFGFISLALIPAPAYRQFGLALGVGVGLALILAMTLTPIFFSLLKAPKPVRVGAAARAQRLLNKVIDFVVHLTKKRPLVIVTGFGVLLALTIIGVTRIEVEKDFIKNFAENNPIRTDLRYFSRHFAGTHSIDVFIESREPGRMIQPDFLKRVAVFQDNLLNIPEVDRVISIVDLLHPIHRLFHGGGAGKRVPPMTKRDISKYLFLLKMSGSDVLESMVDGEGKTLRLQVRLHDSGALSAHKISLRAVSSGRVIFGDRIQIEVTGIIALVGEWLADFLEGQKRGLLFAFITIFAMMAIALRSLTRGLLSMLPNIIPILLLGGYLGWFWDYVDPDVFMVAIIAIGISVDDTIHFLFRYRFERERSEEISIALDRTFHFTGRAIIITSVILVAGFAPFAMADYFLVKNLGTLLPATLAAAMLTDILLIPAMIRLGFFRFKGKGEGKGN